jgi:hypothetical protein
MAQQTGTASAEARACPFREPAAHGCAAAPWRAQAGKTDTDRRCATPDHGDCTLYLVKLLTSLRPHPFAVQRDLWSK